MSTDELQTTLLTTPAELHALEPEWNTLLQASAANNVFLTWEWMAAWWKWHGTGCDLRLWSVRRSRDGRLLGLAPLARRRRHLAGGIPYRELILLGSEPAAADHLDFIVDRESEALVTPRLRECFAATQRKCDFVNLEALVPDSSTLGPWLLTKPRWTRQDRIPAPYVELPATWELYLRGLQRNVRAGINRCGRALADEVHPAPVAYRHIEREEDLDQGMNELIRLHQSIQNWMGNPGSFADPQIAGFHRDVARRFLRKGWLYLKLLTVQEQTIAAIYVFAYAGTYRAFSTGYDRKWQKFGPGRQVMAQAIHDAITQGAHQFDLLRGAEPYKRLLTSQAHDLLFVQAPASPLGMLVHGAHAAVRYGRPLVKRLRNRTQKKMIQKAPHEDTF